MNVQVTLVGSSMTWRFRGSPQWERFLTQKPWDEDGGVILLRLASAEQCPRVMEAAETDLYSASARSNPPIVVRISAAPGSLASELVCDAGALPRAESEHRRIGVIATHCAEKSLAVLVDGCGCAAAPGEPLLQQCRRLVDAVGKRPISGERREARARPRLVIVLLDTARTPLGSDPCDLSCGEPMDSLLDLLHAPESQRWPAYVHVRLAWETGGHYSRCLHWAQGFAFSENTGRDEPLERWLNDRATEAWRRLDYRLQRSVEEYLTLLGQREGSRQTALLLAEELEQEELLAPPGAIGLAAPAPWVARAALRDKPMHPSRVLLRHCMVCQPLARQVLNRCFELEARLRARAAASGDVGMLEITQEFRDRLDSFNKGKPRSAARFYPRAHPSPPTDFLDFASLGEFDRMLINGKRQIENLVALRNALSHGHYVCWESLQALMEAEEDLRSEL